jgi:hypothetical protein
MSPERIIQVKIQVVDENYTPDERFESQYITETCPDDWSDEQIQEELDSIADSTAAIVEAA